MAQSFTTDMEEGWKYTVIPRLDGGLKTDLPAEIIQDSETPALKNVIFKRGRVIVDTGYAAIGQAVEGDPRLGYLFEKRSGTNEALLVTDETLYKWVSGVTEWQYVSTATSTTLSGNEATGQTVLSVTDETGFSASDKIGIVLNDGTMDMTTVASTAAGQITVDDALTGDADSGNAVVQGLTLSGSADIQVDAATVPSNDWFVFTNGVDTPQRYDGTDVADVPGLIAAFTTFKANTVAMFKNYLHFGHTEENGTAHPQRIRHSDVADPTNWTTGDAGSADLLDSSHHIVVARKRGPYLLIYREGSITRREFVGSADQVFDDETIIEGEGAASTHSVAETEDAHVFVGKKNIYRYLGGFELEPIGDDIFEVLFSAEGEIDPANRNLVLTTFLVERNEVLIFYPSMGTGITKAARLSLKNNQWSKRVLGHSITGIGEFERTANLTWTTAPGTWAEYTGTWSSASSSAGARLFMLLANAADQPYLYDFVEPQEAGTDIEWEFETKDFGLPDRQTRIEYVDFKIRGSSISIDYSTDLGSSWSSIGTDSPGVSYTRCRHFKPIVARTVRFRLSGSGAGFGVEWLGIRHRDETADGQ